MAFFFFSLASKEHHERRLTRATRKGSQNLFFAKKLAEGFIEERLFFGREPICLKEFICELGLLDPQIPCGNEHGARISVIIESNTAATANANLETTSGTDAANVTTTASSATTTSMCGDEPLLEPIWEWHYYSKHDNNSNSKDSGHSNEIPKQRQRHNLLIAQYSSFVGGSSGSNSRSYAKLIEKTAPINKEYAKRWNYDYVILHGITMLVANDIENIHYYNYHNYHNNNTDNKLYCYPKEERSRFNKIALLQMALFNKDIYDSMLILDADAMIYDFDYDIPSLLLPNKQMQDDDHNDNTNNSVAAHGKDLDGYFSDKDETDIMLVAHRVNQNDVAQTSNITNGVTLWNLHHPYIEYAVSKWDEACRNGLISSLESNHRYRRKHRPPIEQQRHPFRGDQYYLHQVLKQSDSSNANTNVNNKNNTIRDVELDEINDDDDPTTSKKNLTNVVSALWNEFYYRDGTVIKHFQRSNMFSWNDTIGLQSRLDRIDQATDEICTKHSISKDALEYVNYTTNTNTSTNNTSSSPGLAASRELDIRVFGNRKCGGKHGRNNKNPLRRQPLFQWTFNHHNNSNDNNGNNSKAKSTRRLLIAQYSGYDSTSRQLKKLTSPVNKAYAKKWGYDFLSMEGSALTLPKDGINCEPPYSRAMHNKLFLLHMSLTRNDRYDYLLTLEPDAMIYDFDFDLTDLMLIQSADDDIDGQNDDIQSQFLLAASVTNGIQQTTIQNATVERWNINNKILLWNLHHNLTYSVFEDWYTATINGLYNISNDQMEQYDDDQRYLQEAFLKREGRKAQVHLLPTGFEDERGIKVKHFVKPNSTIWSEKEALDSIEKMINDTIDRICHEHRPDCDNLEYRELDKNDDDGVECLDQPRRQPTWSWIHNSNKTYVRNMPPSPPLLPPRRRMLIAQYSGYGNYTQLLDLTMPVNKAYARKWNHDFVYLQGTTLTFPKDGPCEPPNERSRHNKLYLLQTAWHKRSDYDVLLTLDADAMIYNFSSDISDLVSDTDMLAAHGAGVTEETRTWNINNGICLWNLHHPKTSKIAFDWYKNTRKGMSMVGEKEHGDQHFLQMTLRKGDRQSLVRGLATEFKYKKATVIKHFVRKNNDVWNGSDIQSRQAMIENAILEICQKATQYSEQEDFCMDRLQ